MKTCLVNTSDTASVYTWGGKSRQKETWWWNDVVDCVIKEDSGKSGRIVEKNISKQKRRLSTQLGKAYKKPTLEQKQNFK